MGRTTWIVGTLTLTISLATIGAYLYARPPADPDEVRFRASARAVEELRTRLRHPDAMRVDFISANADGSVVCILYKTIDATSILGYETLAAVMAHGKLDAGADTMFRNTNCGKDVSFKMDKVVKAVNGPLKLDIQINP